MLLPFDGDVLYHSGRIAHGQGVRWDVLYHHAARPNGHIVSDGHARQYGHASSYPHVVAYGDWSCPFVPGVSLLRDDAVAGRVDTHIGPYETMVSYGDKCFVQHHQIEVGKEMLAHSDVLAKVAEERLVDEGVLVAAPQYLLQLPVSLLQQCGPQMIIFPAQVLASVEHILQLLVGCIIDLSSEHFLVFCHLSLSFLSLFV